MAKRHRIRYAPAAAGILLGIVTAASASEATKMTGGDQKMEVLPLPRDPEIAVREEFNLAVQAGTKEALSLFIARHSDHPLAQDARLLLEQAR